MGRFTQHEVGCEDEVSRRSERSVVGAHETNLWCARRAQVTPLTLEQLYVFGKNPGPEQRLANARFLHRELPVRLSQRAVELMNLPHGLSVMPGIQQVHAIRHSSSVMGPDRRTIGNLATRGCVCQARSTFVLSSAAAPALECGVVLGDSSVPLGRQSELTGSSVSPSCSNWPKVYNCYARYAYEILCRPEPSSPAEEYDFSCFLSGILLDVDSIPR